MKLTERQIQILKAIIEEYINTAEPVGSDTLDKKYSLGVSPATIRNEMVVLTNGGFLKQPHTSAGRTPTPEALKFYVEKLMKPQELSVADEVMVKQRVWNYRSELDRFLREATKTLAQQTKAISLAATSGGDIYTSGMSNILDMPEFYDIDMTKHLLETLDHFEIWWEILSRIGVDTEDFGVVLGEDLGRQYLSQCGGVFTRFKKDNLDGVIGIVGPSRLNFPRVVPLVRYMGSLINDITKYW